MKIGIPKEIKNSENRVGATPAGVKEFIRHGHEVYVQHTVMKVADSRMRNISRRGQSFLIRLRMCMPFPI